MKYILCILCVIWLSANQVLAQSYNQEFQTKVQYKNISTQDIESSKLLERHIQNYKSKILSRAEFLGIEKSQNIRDMDIILNAMLGALGAIQNSYISGEKTQVIMQDIVDDLKILNSKIKAYMQQEEIMYQSALEAKKQSYMRILTQVTGQIDELISRLTQYFGKQENLRESQKDMIRTLIELREKNNNLKNFSSLEFNSDGEMQTYIREHIENIRRYISRLKRLSER